MRLPRVLSVSILTLCISSFAAAGDSPWEKKLPFKSATIQYKIKGSMKGSKTLYVKDYGRTHVEERKTKMSMFGIQQLQHEWVLTTPDWEYTLDKTTNDASKTVNPYKYLIEEYNTLSSADKKTVRINADETGFAFIEQGEGEFIANDKKLLGYSCDKINMMGVKAHVIHGTELPLAAATNMMGIKMTEMATKVDTGRVSADKFKLPVGVDFYHDKDADRILKQQARSVINSLLGKASDSAANDDDYASSNDDEMDEYGNDVQTDESGNDAAADMRRLMDMFQPQ